MSSFGCWGNCYSFARIVAFGLLSDSCGCILIAGIDEFCIDNCNKFLSWGCLFCWLLPFEHSLLLPLKTRFFFPRQQAKFQNLSLDFIIWDTRCPSQGTKWSSDFLVIFGQMEEGNQCVFFPHLYKMPVYYYCDIFGLFLVLFLHVHRSSWRILPTMCASMLYLSNWKS